MLKWIAPTLAGLLHMASATAGNQFTFTVIPPQPVAGKPYQLRITKPAEGCGNPLPALIDVADLGGGVIRHAVPGYDFCEQNVPAQDVTYSVPALPAGNYTFRFALCGLFPVDCQTLEDRAVTVLGQVNPARHTIPTLSQAALAMIAALVLAAALKQARPHPPHIR